MTVDRSLATFVVAMALVVVASNILVQYPFQPFGLGELLTWGAFTYPVAFLVNDLTNRHLGPAAARKVVYLGFALAVFMSVFLATPRIAIASGTAFLIAQLLDGRVFDKLRDARWWQAPLISTLAGSALDTILFFALAFSGSFAFLDTMTGQADGSLAFPVEQFGMTLPLWGSLAIGDFLVKIAVGLAMLVPYRLLLRADTFAASRG